MCLPLRKEQAYTHNEAKGVIIYCMFWSIVDSWLALMGWVCLLSHSQGLSSGYSFWQSNSEGGFYSQSGTMFGLDKAQGWESLLTLIDAWKH